MGALLNCLLYDTGPSNHPSTMKAFIFLCLVAAAMAEADPQYVYSGVGYPYTTGLSHYNNFAYSGLYNHYTTPYAHTYAHSYGKRSAEAEAEPWGTYYGGYSGYARPYGYSGYAGYGGCRRGYNGWY